MDKVLEPSKHIGGQPVEDSLQQQEPSEHIGSFTISNDQNDNEKILLRQVGYAWGESHTTGVIVAIVVQAQPPQP